MASEVFYCARTGRREVVWFDKTQGLWRCGGCGRHVKNVVQT